MLFIAPKQVLVQPHRLFHSPRYGQAGAESSKCRSGGNADPCLSGYISQISFINPSSVSSRSSLVRNSHSHTTITRHPKDSRRMRFRRSRSLLRCIFVCQNCMLLFGCTDSLQSWPCQKQPLTNMTVRYLGRTMSGDPGSRLSNKRNLNPLRKRNLLTINSGFVFFAWIRAMISLRFSGATVSAINDPPVSSGVYHETKRGVSSIGSIIERHGSPRSGTYA